jgi:hypothetical protein
VEPCDYDQDGDMDLFIGGRQVPGKYPMPPRSYLLVNDKGIFFDKTETMAPDLLKPGMITTAVWSDTNNDGYKDLIIAGEWMPITFLINNKNGTLKQTDQNNTIDESIGWWNKLICADFDNDGDEDLVAGNLGFNYKYQASRDEPLDIYCDDFDENGTLDIVLGYFNNGTLFPVRGRQCSSEQMPTIKKQFPSYHAFASATLYDIYGEKLNDALHFGATDFKTSYLQNQGNGSFIFKDLPMESQFSSVNAIIAYDFNNDSYLDILKAGNLYGSEVETGRADAGIGYLLQGNGKGVFKNIPLKKSGFFADRNVRELKLIRSGKNNAYVIAGNNNDRIQLFKINSPQ